MKFGVYIHDGFTFDPAQECPYTWDLPEYERYLDWLKAAGVETVEIWPQAGWYRYPTLPTELDRLRVRQQLVEAAHARGMEFMLLLTTNLYSKLPVDQVPPGQASLAEDMTTWCATEPGGYERTLDIDAYFANVYRGLDHADVFAGDWGGCSCGRCGIPEFERYVDDLHRVVAEGSPSATVWANLWSISSWQKRSYDYIHDLSGWRDFWDDEITMSERFLEHVGERPPGLGIAFPLHHWYRGFTQKFYDEGDLAHWPDVPTLAKLHAGGHPLMAWTHFIVENDPYHGDLWGTLSVRLRYLRQLAGRLHEAPFDLVMANVYSARQALNLFAYARWARDPSTSVEDMLAAFVAEVARPEGRSLLTDLLVFLENRDPWEGDMPTWRRLPWLDESGLSGDDLARRVDELPNLLVQDSPLLLNGADGFARTVREALDRARAREAAAVGR